MYWIALVGFLAATACAAQTTKTRNVILVTIDGMRWQEIFNGADAALIESRDGGVRAPTTLKKEFVRDTPELRRKALMPFLWNVIGIQGQIFGDPSSGSPAAVTNGLKFSYPGYNEMLCGHPDSRINSNNKVPNPNVNVLEWLDSLPAYRGRVAAYGTWDRLPFILNVGRSHLPVHSGWEPIADEPLTATEQELNRWLPDLPRVWDDDVFDVVAQRGAMEYIRKHQPRVFYLMLGETDEWAHMRRYDCYLEAAHQNDRFLGQLWEMLQSMPQYAQTTSLIVTTDHGRGMTFKDWTDHGKNTDGAEFVWMAVIGPDTADLGIRRDTKATQSQIAGTIATLLGEDFRTAVPQSAAPLPGAIGAGR